MYAIVEILGKQYKVSPSLSVDVDRLEGKEGETITFSKVILINDDGKVKIGHPAVSRAKVLAKIVKQFRGEKLEVSRFRAKSRYRRHRGFRPSLTRLEIVKIERS